MGRLPRDDGAKPTGITTTCALTGVEVLVVDDNPDARAILEMWFDHLGCEVTTAESADEALVLFPRVRPDIVLTDISMPRRDGYWLLRELRLLQRTMAHITPVVALSACTSIRDTPFPGVRFDACVSKPISFGDLGSLVQRLTRTHRAA